MTDYDDDLKILEKMDQDNILEYVWENLMDDIENMMRDAADWSDRDDRV